MEPRRGITPGKRAARAGSRAEPLGDGGGARRERWRTNPCPRASARAAARPGPPTVSSPHAPAPAVPSRRRLALLTTLGRGPRVLALLERLDARSVSRVRVLDHTETGDARELERRLDHLEQRYSIVSAAQLVDASE